MRSLIICQTCRFSASEKLDDQGRSGGEILTDRVRAVLAARGLDDVVVETPNCLWNCRRHCSVVIRDDERFSYVTGDHSPDLAQAEAIVQWFELHGKSETGEVSFKDWPQAMRGHFIARIPPAQKKVNP